MELHSPGLPGFPLYICRPPSSPHAPNRRYGALPRRCSGRAASSASHVHPRATPCNNSTCAVHHSRPWRHCSACAVSYCPRSSVHARPCHIAAPTPRPLPRLPSLARPCAVRTVPSPLLASPRRSAHTSLCSCACHRSRARAVSTAPFYPRRTRPAHMKGTVVPRTNTAPSSSASPSASLSSARVTSPCCRWTSTCTSATSASSLPAVHSPRIHPPLTHSKTCSPRRAAAHVRLRRGARNNNGTAVLMAARQLRRERRSQTNPLEFLSPSPILGSAPRMHRSGDLRRLTRGVQ